MYAVIKTGGKQYKVAKDQIVVVEKLTAVAGDSVAFDQVLMVGEGEDVKIGNPYVEGSRVSARGCGRSGRSPRRVHPLRRLPVNAHVVHAGGQHTQPGGVLVGQLLRRPAAPGLEQAVTDAVQL